MNYLKVQGNEGLVRDMETKAIINTNSSEYEKHLAQKNVVQARKAEITRQTEEINNIKNDINDIKQMLLSLMNK